MTQEFIKGQGNPDMAFAVRLLRLANSMSQRELAIKLGVPRTYISKIERGHAVPTISSIYRLAEALDAPACVLVAFATFHMYYQAPKEHPAA